MSYINAYPVSFMANNLQQFDGVDKSDMQHLYDQDRHRVNSENRLDAFFNGRCTRVFVAAKRVAHYRKEEFLDSNEAKPRLPTEKPGCATRYPSRDALYQINLRKLDFHCGN